LLSGFDKVDEVHDPAFLVTEGCAELQLLWKIRVQPSNLVFYASEDVLEQRCIADPLPNG
jgi:hypothetical protein